MSASDRLVDNIHSRGLRLTHQRQLVLEILEESQEHLDADALYARAREKDPRISLATIYRTLALLKEVGLIEEHQFGQSHGHFETVAKPPHYHFTCLRCGKVIELKESKVASKISSLCKASGLKVADIKLEITGYCEQCQEEHNDTHTG